MHGQNFRHFRNRNGNQRAENDAIPGVGTGQGDTAMDSGHSAVTSAFRNEGVPNPAI